MTAIDKMYDNYNILVDAGDKITEHEDKYLEILNSVKGSANEKRLASQFIIKFFKHFPTHFNTAIDALLDLCEDEDINIRKQAIKDLPSICKDCKEYVPRITDILAQLLLAEDATELQIVNNSLIAVCKLDPRGFLGGIFLQIEGGEDVTKERVLRFLSTKMKTLPDDTWTKEDEEFILQESRKALLETLTKDDFMCLMSILSSLKISKTITAQQVLIDMITEHAELDNPFNPAEPEQIEKFSMCVKAAIPHFSPFVPSNLFVQYICTQIIPCMNEIIASVTGEITDPEIELLQQLAELSVFIQPTNTNLPINLDECQELVFTKLFDYMPSPSLNLETEEKSEEPTLQLFPLESLMFTLYTLSVHNPEFNSKIEEDRMKDYKLRLQYLARLIQGHIKKAREAVSGDKTTDSAEAQTNAMTLRTATNINTLVKELFHPKPASKSSVTLSWKPIKTKAAAIKRPNSSTNESNNGSTTAPTTKTDETASNPTNPKRKPITAPEDSGPKKEQGRKLYAPPSGKFSHNFRGGYQNNRGRGGGFRGGNRGRNNNNRYSKRYSN